MRGSSQAKKQEVYTVSGVESGVGELQEILKNLEMASKPARRLIAISVPLTTFSSSTRSSAAFREREQNPYKYIYRESYNPSSSERDTLPLLPSVRRYLDGSLLRSLTLGLLLLLLL